MELIEGASGEPAESRALTGLRGMAAFLVMSHHLYLKVGLDQHLPILQWGLRKGYLGVDLFFVLSGFVMSMVYGGWFRFGGAGRNYVRYIVRRVARLWPLHGFMLAVVLASEWAAGRSPFSARVILENLAMVQAWGHSTEINPPAWSISTELLAYVLFPLLAVMALRGVWRPVLCLVLVGLAFWACMAFSPPIGLVRRGRLDIYFNYSPLPALRCLSGFVVGMLAWRVGQDPVIQRLLRGAWAGPVLLAAMLGMMLGRVNDLLIFPVLPLVVLGMHFGRGPVHRAFGAMPLHGLGVLSYAIYLLHVTLLRAFPFGAYPMRYMLPFYVGSTIALAAVMHVLIERPGRRLIRSAGERALAGVWPMRVLQDRAP